MQKRIDAIDELVARSKDHPELLTFHRYHRANPEVLDFLVQEIELRRSKGFGAFSFASLWHYARWKIQLDNGPSETYEMNDHMTPMYGRAILILHPHLNGLAELRARRDGGRCLADQIFGTKVAEVKLPGDYARRLVWEDGTAIEDGWRPTIRHEPRHAANRRPDVHPRDNDGE